MIVLGLIGSGVIGLYVEKTRLYKKTIMICTVIYIIASLLFMLGVYT